MKAKGLQAQLFIRPASPSLQGDASRRSGRTARSATPRPALRAPVGADECGEDEKTDDNDSQDAQNGFGARGHGCGRGLSKVIGERPPFVRGKFLLEQLV